jgi:hypothetical protein
MKNIEKELESILKDVKNIVALGYNSTEKLEKNTVEWAVCHRFYSEGISLEYKVKELLEESKNSKKDPEKETECECCSNNTCANDTVEDDDNLPF